MAGLGLKVGRACVDFLLASCKAGGSSRPCLVYVPGLSSVRRSQKSEAFKALALEELGFNYITLDLTGHGDASGTLQELTPAKAIADLTNVLQYFAGENSRYYLVGASFGAMVAAWTMVETRALGATSSIHVAGLVMLSPGLGLKERLSQGNILKSQYCPDIVLSQQFVDELDRYSSAKLAKAIDKEGPIVAVHGEEDEVIPISLVQQWTAGLSQCTLFNIPQGNHRLNLNLDSILRWAQAYIAQREAAITSRRHS